MKDSLNAYQVLELIEARRPPLDFSETVMPVYRAAVRRIARMPVPEIATCDLGRVPFNGAFIDAYFESLNRYKPTIGRNEQAARDQWKTRVRTVLRKLQGQIRGAMTPEWGSFVDSVVLEGRRRSLADQALIPLTNTLPSVATEHGLSPADVTRDWLNSCIATATPKRRSSLRTAAHLLDDFHDSLPFALRPVDHPIGPIETPSPNRRGRPLPSRLTNALNAYQAERIKGPVAMGIDGPVQIGEGIDPVQTAPAYKHALAWYRDCLIDLDLLDAEADPEPSEIADLDKIRIVAVESLADLDRKLKGQCTRFEWNPIDPKTLRKRLIFLTRMFRDTVEGFAKQTTVLNEQEGRGPVPINSSDVVALVSQKIKGGITPHSEAFYRRIISDDKSRATLLNLHTLLWSEAQAAWATFFNQPSAEQCRTLNLCGLAAITAIATSFPFRRHTMMQLTVTGISPDVTLPAGKTWIDFDIPPERMKARKGFEGTLRDTGTSQPRRILDWYMAGPRQALLSHDRCLPPANRDPSRLFCGMSEARYNQCLSEWTEEFGLKMTTHLFRHALASILTNNLDMAIDHAGAMLSNTAETVGRNYVFFDSVKRRQTALEKLEEARAAMLPDVLHARTRRTSE